MNRMEKEIKAIEKEMIQIVWYMRGGVSLNEAYALSPDDRQAIGKLIEKNLEITKDSGLPFF